MSSLQINQHQAQHPPSTSSSSSRQRSNNPHHRTSSPTSQIGGNNAISQTNSKGIQIYVPRVYLEQVRSDLSTSSLLLPHQLFDFRRRRTHSGHHPIARSPIIGQPVPINDRRRQSQSGQPSQRVRH